VLFVPEQTLLTGAVIVPGTDAGIMIAETGVLVADIQPVVVFLDWIKYFVVPSNVGVVNDETPLPPLNTEILTESAYQSVTEPAGADEVNTTDPSPHLETSVAEGAKGMGLMVI